MQALQEGITWGRHSSALIWKSERRGSDVASVPCVPMSPGTTCPGVLLSLIGSAAGLVAGALVYWGTRSWGGLPISVSMFWAAAGSVATVLAGTLISFFPAAIAARIQPVEALRYD